MLIIFQLVIGVLIFYASNILISDYEKMFVLEMTSICMMVVNIRYMLIYVLQITNRIKEYAKIIILEKLYI